MRVALDTNVLAYAEGVDDVERRNAALALIRRLPRKHIVVPVQVLGELFNVLMRKGARSPREASATIIHWKDAFIPFQTSLEAVLAATDLAAAHRFGIWDAVILSAAAEGGCRLLLSEDMQEGFTWGGVTVTNPFAPTRHPLLEALLHEQT